MGMSGFLLAVGKKVCQLMLTLNSHCLACFSSHSDMSANPALFPLSYIGVAMHC